MPAGTCVSRDVVLLQANRAGRPTRGRRDGGGYEGSDKQGAQNLHDSRIRRGARESYARMFDSSTITIGTRKSAIVNAASRGLLRRIVLCSVKISFLNGR